MSLLTICNAIADTTSGPRPPSIVGNQNPEAQSYLRSVQKVSARLAKVYDWNVLRKEFAFTSPGTETILASADFPTDFDRFIPETFWNRSTTVLLSGPVSGARWGSLKAEGFVGDNTQFTYRGGDILAIPTVDAGSDLVFEYMSTQFVRAADDTPKATFTLDTDTSLIDEELIALAATADWLANEGQPYQQAFNDYKEYFDMLQENENATENIAVAGDIFSQQSRHWDGAPVASRTVDVGY